VAEYLKLPEVARRLDVSEKTARRYVRSGELPSVFIGGAYRVSESDLAEFLERAKVDPGKVEAPPSQATLFNGEAEEERRLVHLGAWRRLISDLRKRWLAESQEFLDDEEPDDYGALVWWSTNREVGDAIWRAIVNGLIIKPGRKLPAPRPTYPPEGPERTELEAVCEDIDALRELIDDKMRRVVMELHERAKARETAADLSNVEDFAKAQEIREARRAAEVMREQTKAPHRGIAG
jgi:excisionase family DNA binding protein